MSKILVCSIIVTIFLLSCSSSKVIMVIHNDSDTTLTKLRIGDGKYDNQINYKSITPKFSIKKDTQYQYTQDMKEDRILAIYGELIDGDRTDYVYNDIDGDTTLEIHLKRESKAVEPEISEKSIIILESYEESDKIIAGEHIKLQIKTNDPYRFDTTKSYKVKLEKYDLLTPYVITKSDTILEAEFKLPKQVGIIGEQKLRLYDAEDRRVGSSGLIIASENMPIFKSKYNISKVFFEKKDYVWVQLTGDNFIDIYGEPRIVNGNVEIDSYKVLSDTTLKVRIRYKGRHKLTKFTMDVPYLYAKSFNLAERRVNSVHIELATNDTITQYLEIRGDVAANFSAQDSLNANGSGSGGMIWNYKTISGPEIRIGAFYSLLKADTIQGDVPSPVYGASLLNPFLGQGAKIELEVLNWFKFLKFLTYPLKCVKIKPLDIFNTPKFGIYVNVTFNKLIWKGPLPITDSKGNIIKTPTSTDSIRIETREGQNTISRIGINFIPFDQQKVGGGDNIASLKFETGLTWRTIDADLGLGANREFRNYLLRQPLNKENLKLIGFEFATKFRFNQLFADIRYTYFSGNILGFSDSRIFIQVGIEGSILKVSL